MFRFPVMLRPLVFFSLLAVPGALVACRGRDEVAPPEVLQTVGIKLEAPGLRGPLDLAVSLPEKADPQPVVEALSGALHRSLQRCAGGSAPLRFDTDRVLAMRLRGDGIEAVVTEAAQGTACLIDALEEAPLSRRFDTALDVHVLLRAVAAAK